MIKLFDSIHIPYQIIYRDKFRGEDLQLLEKEDSALWTDQTVFLTSTPPKV